MVMHYDLVVGAQDQLLYMSTESRGFREHEPPTIFALRVSSIWIWVNSVGEEGTS